MGRPGEGRRDSAGWAMGEREDSWKCARVGCAAFAVRIAPFRARTIAGGHRQLHGDDVGERGRCCWLNRKCAWFVLWVRSSDTGGWVGNER